MKRLALIGLTFGVAVSCLGFPTGLVAHETQAALQAAPKADDKEEAARFEKFSKPAYQRDAQRKLYDRGAGSR